MFLTCKKHKEAYGRAEKLVEHDFLGDDPRGHFSGQCLVQPRVPVVIQRAVESAADRSDPGGGGEIHLSFVDDGPLSDVTAAIQQSVETHVGDDRMAAVECADFTFQIP